MNNEIANYYDAQETDINLNGVFKILTSAIASIGVSVACNAIANSLITPEAKSVKFNIPGGDVKILYNLADTRCESDGDYYEMNFNVTVFRRRI